MAYHPVSLRNISEEEGRALSSTRRPDPAWLAAWRAKHTPAKSNPQPAKPLTLDGLAQQWGAKLSEEKRR
jgi:hypothetical protein